eukprot:GHVU01138353.1.p1 GENE.GHVU01138353.1~~GHVU01138353.1.p1  ORF type:complete len:290 (+),score=21.06 GHVU01138353.1:967-1836(+)
MTFPPKTLPPWQCRIRQRFSSPLLARTTLRVVRRRPLSEDACGWGVLPSLSRSAFVASMTNVVLTTNDDSCRCLSAEHRVHGARWSFRWSRNKDRGHPPSAGAQVAGMHARTHACTHTQACTHTHARMHTRTHACVHTHTYKHAQAYTRVHTQTYTPSIHPRFWPRSIRLLLLLLLLPILTYQLVYRPEESHGARDKPALSSSKDGGDDDDDENGGNDEDLKIGSNAFRKFVSLVRGLQAEVGGCGQLGSSRTHACTHASMHACKTDRRRDPEKLFGFVLSPRTSSRVC